MSGSSWGNDLSVFMFVADNQYIGIYTYIHIHIYIKTPRPQSSGKVSFRLSQFRTPSFLADRVLGSIADHIPKQQALTDPRQKLIWSLQVGRYHLILRLASGVQNDERLRGMVGMPAVSVVPHTSWS